MKNTFFLKKFYFLFLENENLKEICFEFLLEHLDLISYHALLFLPAPIWLKMIDENKQNRADLISIRDIVSNLKHLKMQLFSSGISIGQLEAISKRLNRLLLE